MNKKIDIIIFKDEELKLEVRVNPEEDTVWLTQRQMAELFGVSVDNISLHIKNIFNEQELEQDSATEESSVTASDGKNYRTRLYNLDVIISVGYRIKSKRGIIFRKWANKVLKEYMYQGFVIDQKRLITSEINYKTFTSTVKLITDLVDRKKLTADESTGLLKVISKYTYALDTLDKYDHQILTIANTTQDNKQIKLDYEDAMKEIKKMPDYGKSKLFGKEKDQSFHGALNAIYQTAFGVDVYPSIEEKAANLLYFIVKDHAFYDGNKRIAASIFLWFLDIYNILYKEDGSRVLEDNALVAIVLMIALSNPNERDVIVKIIINLINKNN
ncbi:Fic/DOC family protein [Alteracholeplasma palmae J233]|uniref:Fic/DOC family protein n=1 Tax=Alteracholeplasma palmae (strain ATCC 49389 / J233) TaxID=1318466 RepID=U4KJK6_ALTPJ|nr:virulence protein RhuM/Fic/DOC family protein [Alteracholeplasma palmae]CCV63679.1 Fic/DOC family protein [Alteracholeplasma palmae J233]